MPNLKARLLCFASKLFLVPLDRLACLAGDGEAMFALDSLSTLSASEGPSCSKARRMAASSAKSALGM